MPTPFLSRLALGGLALVLAMAGCNAASTTPAEVDTATEAVEAVPYEEPSHSVDGAEKVWVVSKTTHMNHKGDASSEFIYDVNDAGEILSRTITDATDVSSGPRVTEFTYDPSGVFTRAKGPQTDIVQTVDEKDEAGRPVKVTRTDNLMGETYVYQIEYLDTGGVKSIGISGDVDSPVTYHYNENGWIYTAVDEAGWESPLALGMDGYGRINSVFIPHNGYDSVKYTYDANGRIATREDMFKTIYTRDANGNVVHEKREGGLDTMPQTSYEYVEVQPTAWLSSVSMLVSPGDFLNTTMTPQEYVTAYFDFYVL
jgi:hypothetical protein